MSLDLAQIIPWTRRGTPARYRAISLELPHNQIILDIISHSWPLLVMNDYLEDRNLYYDFVTSTFRPIHVYTEEPTAGGGSPYKWDNRYVTVIKKVDGIWKKCMGLPENKRRRHLPKRIIIRREAKIPSIGEVFALFDRFYHREEEMADRYVTTTALSFFLAKYLVDNPDDTFMKGKRAHPEITEDPVLEQVHPLPYAVPIVPRYVREGFLCWSLPLHPLVPIIRIWAPTALVEPPETPESQVNSNDSTSRCSLAGQRPFDFTSL